MELHNIPKALKEKAYLQEYSTWQGYHSELKER